MGGASSSPPWLNYKCTQPHVQAFSKGGITRSKKSVPPHVKHMLILNCAVQYVKLTPIAHVYTNSASVITSGGLQIEFMSKEATVIITIPLSTTTNFVKVTQDVGSTHRTDVGDMHHAYVLIQCQMQLKELKERYPTLQ